MKRREFFVSAGLGGLGLSIFSDSLLAQKNSPALLHFVAVGDVGTGDQGQYAIAKAMTQYSKTSPFPFILLAGDNIYNNGEIEKINAVFEKPYQELLKKGVRFYGVLGNHDIRTRNGEDQLRYPGFNMKGRYYTFSQKSVQFFALDTNVNAPWKQQLKWLEQQLAKSQAIWKVVFGHYPLYSSGAHGSDRLLTEWLAPLFSKYKVQLYISGHDHNYERTKPIQGTTYIVCGAGAGTRPVGHSSWTAFATDRLSFAAFTVYPDLIEIKGIDKNGTVFDQGKMVRNT